MLGRGTDGKGRKEERVSGDKSGRGVDRDGERVKNTGMAKTEGQSLEQVEAGLREFALGYPEAWEDFPWGERVFKVRKKIFLFMGLAPEGLGLSVKLPHSHAAAMMLTWTEPTGYGLGRAGWVSARIKPGQQVPVDFLMEWVDESYRAVAPKGLSAKAPALRS